MSKSASTTATKQTRSSRVLQTLRQAILGGELTPGEKLNLEQLRERYQLSLSPLREALSRLLAERLVILEDLRGYRVAPITPADLREVTQLRAEMEALALRYAISGAGLEWESGVPAALHRLKRAVRSGARAEISAAHEGFHTTLTSGCDLHMLCEFTGVLRNLHLRYRNVLGFAAKDRDLNAEHAAIAEATLHRDADLAPTLLKRHIERSGDELSTRLGAHLAGRSGTG